MSKHANTNTNKITILFTVGERKKRLQVCREDDDK